MKIAVLMGMIMAKEIAWVKENMRAAKEKMAQENLERIKLHQNNEILNHQGVTEIEYQRVCWKSISRRCSHYYRTNAEKIPKLNLKVIGSIVS